MQIIIEFSAIAHFLNLNKRQIRPQLSEFNKLFNGNNYDSETLIFSVYF